MRIAWWKFCSAINTVRPYARFSSRMMTIVCTTSSGERPTERSSTSRSFSADQNAGGLVEQQQYRGRHEGTRDREHVLLPARDGSGELAHPLLEDRKSAEAELE